MRFGTVLCQVLGFRGGHGIQINLVVEAPSGASQDFAPGPWLDVAVQSRGGMGAVLVRTGGACTGNKALWRLAPCLDMDAHFHFGGRDWTLLDAQYAHWAQP